MQLVRQGLGGFGACAEPRQLQASRPPFSALLKEADNLRVKRSPGHTAQQLRSFLGGKRQIGHSQIKQTILCSQARQREWWYVARNNDEMDLARKPVDKAGHQFVDSRVLDQLIVIEHHNQGFMQGGEVPHQRV